MPAGWGSGSRLFYVISVFIRWAVLPCLASQPLNVMLTANDAWKRMDDVWKCAARIRPRLCGLNQWLLNHICCIQNAQLCARTYRELEIRLNEDLYAT